MMKTKILLPILGIAGLGSAVIPLANCSPTTVVKETLNISEDGKLLGFKEDITDEDIKKQFGDTLTIPRKLNQLAKRHL